jgi:cytochrome c peroxidase
MKVPADNPMTAAKVQLGHQLFFDPRMSASGTKSCYSCHQNEDGTGGHDPVAIKDNGEPAGRHAPIMWNVGYLTALYWDGRAQTLEQQGLAAWAGMLGVGKDNLAKKAAEIGAIAGYKTQFDKAFPGEAITPEVVIKAIATYERTMVCADTAYDKYQAGDKAAMTAKQVAGYKLFIGKAACTSCHTVPFFSDAYTTPQGAYHNVGVGTAVIPKADVDSGRKKVTGIDSQWSAFKTPSLRNVTESGPYFHDGSAITVKEATKLMASGGLENEFLDPQLKDRHLTGTELALLIDFLGALECPGQLAVPLLPP